MSVDLSSEIEHFTSSILGDIDLFDAIFKKIIIIEFHENNLFHWAFVVENIVSGSNCHGDG